MAGRGRMQLGACAMLLLLASAGATVSRGSGPAATSPPMLTLLVAHAAWTMTDNCVPVPGVLTLGQLQGAFVPRGLHPTATVITGWVHDRRTCIEPLPLAPVPKPLQIASWQDLHALGWSVVSASKTYASFDQIGRLDQIEEACGSLGVLARHGLDGRGMFAYPNNDFGFGRTAADAQKDVVLPCGYAWGRKYAGGPNTVTTEAYPHLARTLSVNGGACHNPSLPCYRLGTTWRYQSPGWVAQAMHPASGEWNVVQIYRLVTGSRLTGRTRWDCTPEDWRDRWTGSNPASGDPMSGDPTEVYCWRDYLAAIDAIPRGTMTVSPAQVPHSRTGKSTAAD